MKDISAKFGDSGRLDWSSMNDTNKNVINADNSITAVRPRRMSNQELIHELSGVASQEIEVKKDNQIMERTLDEIGSNGCRLQGVSVWLFDHYWRKETWKL